MKDMETLLNDAIDLLMKISEDPEIVTALRAKRSTSTSKSNSTPSEVAAPPTQNDPMPSAEGVDVDNLFLLFKLKRRFKKRIIPMRI